MYSTHENISVACTVRECDNFETRAWVKSWVAGICLTKENCFCHPSIHFTGNTHSTICGCPVFSLWCSDDTATDLLQQMESWRLL